METKKSKVVEIKENYRKYTTQRGTNFVHGIEFENGDKGDYSSQSEKCTKFIKGQEFTYTIEENGGFAPKIKPVMDATNGQGKKPYYQQNEALILWEACLKASCELHAEKGGSNTADLEKKVLDSTEKFYNEGKKLIKQRATPQRLIIWES